MGGRNDGSLYTGTTSMIMTDTTKKVAKKREKSKQDRLDVAHTLKPAAQIVQGVAEDERAKIEREIINLSINIDTAEGDVKCALMAYQRTLKYIEGFQKKVNDKLREVNL